MNVDVEAGAYQGESLRKDYQTIKLIHFQHRCTKWRVELERSIGTRIIPQSHLQLPRNRSNPSCQGSLDRDRGTSLSHHRRLHIATLPATLPAQPPMVGHLRSHEQIFAQIFRVFRHLQ